MKILFALIPMLVLATNNASPSSAEKHTTFDSCQNICFGFCTDFAPIETNCNQYCTFVFCVPRYINEIKDSLPADPVFKGKSENHATLQEEVLLEK